MKVLHVAETIKGGVGTILNSLVLFQQLKGLDVSIVVPDEHHFIIDEKIKKITFFKRKGRGIKSLVNLWVTVKKEVRRLNPDIIHVHSSYAGIICRILIRAMGFNCKVIYCPHAFSFLMVTGRLKNRKYTYIEKKLSLLCDKVVCVSKYEYDKALEIGIEGKKLELIYNGVSNSKLKYFNEEAKGEYKILFVGRLDTQKGFDILIDSLNKIKNQKYKLKLNVIGDTVNDSFVLSDICNDFFEIVFHGWLTGDKIKEFYQDSDLIVVPSRWEGFALVPLEAMSNGLPLILSDIEPFKELSSFTNAITYFSLEKNQELYDHLINLDSFDFIHKGQELYNSFEKNFTIDKMNEKYIKLYQEVGK